MSNDAAALREHLFETLNKLQNRSMSIEDAKAICDVSQTVINLAKVEVEYAKATGIDLTGGFLSPQSQKLTGVTVHKLRG
jgi:hypothetical protein